MTSTKKTATQKVVAKKTPASKTATKKTASEKTVSTKSKTIDFVKDMMEKAKAAKKSLVLPEGNEQRTLQAAVKIVTKKLASKVILLGDRGEIENLAKSLKVSIDNPNIEIINPITSPWLSDFGQTYFELRQGKINKKTNAPEVPDAEAGKQYLLKDYLSFGAMMVRKGYADAMVSGARATTATLLRAGLKVIGTEIKTASSCFVVDTHNPKIGCKGLFIFSDCSVVPDPDSDQLSDIAISAGKSCKKLLNAEPAVAMISFSTKGSGGNLPQVLKVQEAVKKAHEKAPDLLLDGELQVDAALVPEITDIKAPGSPIRGKVNTLIFPNLGVGNTSYKFVQRLANADAYGPILQGYKKPISDLSRGCSIEDIVITSAITLFLAS